MSPLVTPHHFQKWSPDFNFAYHGTSDKLYLRLKSAIASVLSNIALHKRTHIAVLVRNPKQVCNIVSIHVMDSPTAWDSLVDWSAALSDDRLNTVDDYSLGIGFDCPLFQEFCYSAEVTSDNAQAESDPLCPNPSSSVDDASILLSAPVASINSQLSAESAVNPYDNLGNTASTTAKKRRWMDSIVVFGANEETKVTVRKRKNFSPTRKKEVAMNRRVGACLQCRIRKGRVCAPS